MEEEEQKRKKMKRKAKNDAMEEVVEASGMSSGRKHEEKKKRADRDLEEETEKDSRNDEKMKEKRKKKKKRIDFEEVEVSEESKSEGNEESIKGEKYKSSDNSWKKKNNDKESADLEETRIASRNDEEKKKKKKKKMRDGEEIEVNEKSKIFGDKESDEGKECDNPSICEEKKNKKDVDRIGNNDKKRVNLDEEVEVESRGDELEKKKKKKKKERDEEVTKSAGDEESADGGKMEEEEKKKSDAVENNGAKSVNLDEEIEIESRNDELKKRKKKEKERDIEVTTSAGGKVSNGIEEHTTSSGSKKKRKRTDDSRGESDNNKKKKDHKDVATERMKSQSRKAKKGDKDEGNKKTSKSNLKITREKGKSKSKRVSFSGEVEVFPPSDDNSHGKENDGDGLVHGKRFSPDEDQMIRDAVQKYIDTHRLGEEGLQMVLHVKKNPQVRGCWKEICAALPHRPLYAVYGRAQVILTASGKRGFTEEEIEIIQKFHADHGPQWKKLSEILGKHRIHIKDAWRRFRLPNVKLGKWSMDEYQKLFDLVNMDLRMRAFGEGKSDNVMIRDNIPWESISDKMETRIMSGCCQTWYFQLTSSLVRQGEWADTDDYRLVYALQNQDACNVEDVEWDSLLEHRSGKICQRRWDEMVRCIGGHRERPFIEQVEILSKRYSIDMLKYRKLMDGEEVEEEERLC